MVGLGSVRNYPAHIRELAVLDIGENRGLRNYHVVHPVSPRADEFPILLFRNAHVLDRVGRRPDRAGRGSVVLPGDPGAVQYVGECGMFEARVDGRVGSLASPPIDHPHGLIGRTQTSRIGLQRHVFRGEQWTVCVGS